MLVHCPEVVDPSCVESTADKAFSKLLACHIRFSELEILLYELPRFARSSQDLSDGSRQYSHLLGNAHIKLIQ